MAMEWASEPFQRKPWGVRLEDTIADSFYTTRDGSSGEGLLGEIPKPGAVRYEDGIRGAGQYKNVQCHGECWFRWGVNRSGTTFALGEIARRTADLAVTADSDGTTTTINDGTTTFVADEEVGNTVFILNAASGAGAAPEGEWAVIVKNTGGTLTVQPAFSTAVLDTDTAVVHRLNHLGLLGGAIERYETFGVTIASGGVADNTWGWFLAKGMVTAGTLAGEAFAAGEGLIGAAGGLLDSSSTSAQDLMLARAVSANTGDLVLDLVPVYFDVLSGAFTTT